MNIRQRSIAENEDYLLEEYADGRKEIIAKVVRRVKEKKVPLTTMLPKETVAMLDKQFRDTKLPKWHIINESLKAHLIKSKIVPVQK